MIAERRNHRIAISCSSNDAYCGIQCRLCLLILHNSTPKEELIWEYMQGHAGTIPMPMRKDPATAAAEAILWLEQRCGGGSYEELSSLVSPEESLMCTTGSINLWPNAFNVVPGSANFSLDIRYDDWQ